MPTRRHRSERPPARAFASTPRDVAVLAFVGRAGVATSAQIARLFFPDTTTAHRRLAKLVALRALDVHVVGSTVPNLFTLGAHGVATLREHGVTDDEIHRPRVRHAIDRHLELLTDVRVEFERIARERDDIVLHRFVGDLDLRRAAGASPPAYVPDGLVDLELPSGRLVVVCEIDTGVEDRGVFGKKVDLTVRMWRDGRGCWGAPAGSWRPVAFVPTETPARTVCDAAEKSPSNKTSDGSAALCTNSHRKALYRTRSSATVLPRYSTPHTPWAPRRETLVWGHRSVSRNVSNASPSPMSSLGCLLDFVPTGKRFRAVAATAKRTSASAPSHRLCRIRMCASMI